MAIRDTSSSAMGVFVMLARRTFGQARPEGRMVLGNIRIRNQGALTIPVKLREKYNLKEGDLLHLLDLDGIFVLTKNEPELIELAAEIERERIEMGVSVQEMLDGLRDQRSRYYQERYAGTSKE